MAKKVGFFEKVVTGLTGKTAEQRQADALLRSQIQQKQMASYRAEQLARAGDVGKARADWEVKQQIANVGKPKPVFNINIGEFGKFKEGFDPNNLFGEKSAHKQVGWNVNEAINFGNTVGFRNRVVKKIKKKRRR